MDLDGKWFYCQKIFIAFIIFSDKVSETAAGKKMWGAISNRRSFETFPVAFSFSK